MKNWMIALAIFALGCSGFSQSGSPYVTLELPQGRAVQPPAVEAASNSPTAIQTCYWTFTSGSGNTYLSYCITPNANITYLETPHGYVQINRTYPACLAARGTDFVTPMSRLSITTMPMETAETGGRLR
jgi:hypothetical protein